MAKHPIEKKVTPAEVEKDIKKDYAFKEKPEDLEESYESYLEITFESDEEEDTLAKRIRTEIDEILEDQEELKAEWGEADDAYDGILPDKNFPFEGCSNINVPIMAEKTDAITSRIEEAIWTVQPLWIVKPMKDSTPESADKKEKLLDYAVRRETDLEPELSNVIHDATNKGTGILENPWNFEEELLTDIENYPGSKQGLAEFLENYPDPPENQKQRKLYNKFLSQLKRGEDVEFIVEYPEAIWNGPDPRHVSLEDFIVPIDCKQLRKAHIHGKHVVLTGDELLQKVKNKKYSEEKVNRLRYAEDKEGNQTTDEVDSFSTKEFDFYILIYKYDTNDDGIEERCLIDYAYEKGIIMKAIKYPYWHKRSYFIPFYISSRSKGFYRAGMKDLLKDVQELANVLINLFVDCTVIGAVPTFKALEGAKELLKPQLNKGWYPGVTFWVQTQEDMQTMPIVTPNLGFMATLITFMEKFAELRSGASQYMTGKESPMDARAPAAKVMMLIKEANIRISQYINNIKRSMAELAYQMVELYYQFMPEGKEYEIMGSEGKPAFPKITRKELKERAVYIPHGSVEVFARALNREINKEIFETLDSHPIIMANPEARRFLMETYIKSAGADWDTHVHKLVPTPEEFEKMQIRITKEAIKAIQTEQAAKGQRLRELMTQGAPEAEAVQMVEQEFAERSQAEEKAKQTGKPVKMPSKSKKKSYNPMRKTAEVIRG